MRRVTKKSGLSSWMLTHAVRYQNLITDTPVSHVIIPVLRYDYVTD